MAFAAGREGEARRPANGSLRAHVQAEEIARGVADEYPAVGQHGCGPAFLAEDLRASEGFKLLRVGSDEEQFVIGLEYYHDGPLPALQDKAYREEGTTEYLHRLEDLVGGLCTSGFVIEALREPKRADYQVDVSHFGYRGRFIPPYIRIKARRRTRNADEQTSTVTSTGLWLPR